MMTSIKYNIKEISEKLRNGAARVACHIAGLNASNDNKVDDDAKHVSFFGIARKPNQHLNFSFFSLLLLTLSIVLNYSAQRAALAQHRKLIFLFSFYSSLCERERERLKSNKLNIQLMITRSTII